MDCRMALGRSVGLGIGHNRGPMFELPALEAAEALRGAIGTPGADPILTP